jgi:hypothetical protein
LGNSDELAGDSFGFDGELNDAITGTAIDGFGAAGEEVAMGVETSQG